MNEPAERRGDLLALAALALVKLVFHVATSQGWGWFRDELYYVACSERMAWGYVDQPPLSIALLWLARRVLGDSLPAIRFFSALAAAATVFVTGLIARELGGRRAAQLLAGLCTFFAPVFLVMGHYYSMNGIDVLCWAVLALLAVRILQRDEPRLWLWFGVVAGIGLENKYSVAFFAAGLVGGLLLTRQRRHLASPWLWTAGAVAALLIAPHLWWEVRNGLPSLEFMAAATAEKNVRLGPLEFLLGQITLVHPLAAPIWMIGLAALLARPAWAAVRPLGIAYVIIFAVFVVQGGKVYYLAPIYPLLFGAGAAAIDAACARRAWRWPLPAADALMALVGLATVPTAVPVLPVESQLAYFNAIGLSEPRMENNQRGVLPQHLADYFGWQELVETIARVADHLPPAERARAVVMTRNYGEAGAVEVLGRDRNLPRAISGHNNYWLWGPGDLRRDDVVIVLGSSSEALSELFESVQLVDTVRCTYCMPYQNDVPVHLARGLKLPLAEAWRRVKRFI
jgi:hypothetical protein